MVRSTIQICLLLAACLLPTSAAAADLTVAADGSGDVRTVQEAIDKVPANNARRFVIAVKPGTYREQVRISAAKPYISLIGSSAEKTTLTFGLSNKDAGSTSASYATYIGGHDFYAENITFENSFGQGSQAVAILVEADRAVFNKCRFLGWQDTLYAKNGRQYYKDCYIEGHVDYIFGQAAAVFDNCHIHSKADGYIAAPMRFAADEASGFVFSKCRLTSSNTKDGVYLGRPWRDYGRTVYLNTRIDAHIRPEGWHHWLPEREKTAYFAEYRSFGTGASVNKRVKWSRQLNDAEAKRFAAANFLRGRDGWKPGTATDEWLTKTKPDWKLITWSEVFRQPAPWYQTDEAARIADQVVLYQKENGGWEKNIDMALMLTKKERAALGANRRDTSETTIDNRATHSQIAYLARVITASLQKQTPPTNFPRYKEAFDRGVDYLLAAQYENGGFPQVFPLRDGYYSHITFNDDAMIGALNVLRDIANSENDYKFVDDGRRRRAAAAVAKSVALIPKLQMEIDGKKTVWAQQYDNTTLRPAWARKFEPPALASGESAAIVRFLMGEKPTPEIVAAIEAAIKWFTENKITGVSWERKDGENILVANKNTPAIWARFYEFATMRPIFIGRDSIIRYDVKQIDAERRNGYAWYVDSPYALLTRDYPKWKAQNDLP